MKYSSFVTPSGLSSWGVLGDNRLYDLGDSGSGVAPTLKDAVVRGILGSASDRYLDAPGYPQAEVQFLPVITDPGKIICVGVNYRSHQQESGRIDPTAPTIFTRFADSQMGHLQPAQMPAVTDQFDYEGEMALVIGKPAYRVTEADAWDYIAGYAAYNDFSVRDWQRATTQWTPGKNFPGTGAFGPYLVPAADLGDVTALDLQTRVNGEIRQKASLADLYFTIPQLLAHITTFTALAAGDVVVTGTPGGVGLFMEPSGLLKDGDIVEVEITGLGVLRNTVTRVS